MFKTLLFLALTTLAGCAYLPGPAQGTMEDDEANVALKGYTVAVAEPAPNEIVVVINNNAWAGNHAGVWVGRTLLDPAGSYARVRASDPDWQPGLVDYLRYQLLDGARVQSYRFTLDAATAEILRRRIEDAGVAMPLNCALDVKRIVAGVGPFATWAADDWLSPARLARELDALADGVCQMPDGQACPALLALPGNAGCPTDLNECGP